jgi:hypothetical protein
MTYRGRVESGVIVLDDAPPLPEGTEVQVEVMPAPAGGTLASSRAWLLELARDAERSVPGLPSDLAEHHDHYAHGAPLP